MTASLRISPFLWFDGRAEEAANFYVSLFPNSRMLSVERLTVGPAAGNAVVEFELDGLKFGGVDGGPMYKLSPAISFIIPCDSQEEIDYYWDRLSDGGTPNQCGWVEDKFGVSWQVTPSMMPELMANHPDAVLEAMLQMQKIDIEQLRRAGEAGC